MNFKTISFSTIAAGIALASTMTTMEQAHAATVFSFNFARAGGSGELVSPSATFSQTVGADTMSVTATGSGQGAAQVFWGYNGLGVRSQGDNSAQIDGSPQVGGGLNPLERLQLVFTPGVRLLTATFGRVGRDDDFTLFVHGNQVFQGPVPGAAPSGDSGVGTANFSSAGLYFVPQNSRTGTTFEFGTINATDEYFLRGVSVKTVPTPALLPGLVAFGAAALRKRKVEVTAETVA